MAGDQTLCDTGEESVEEATTLGADNLRIEGVWVWSHDCRRVGARRT